MATYLQETSTIGTQISILLWVGFVISTLTVTTAVSEHTRTWRSFLSALYTVLVLTLIRFGSFHLGSNMDLCTFGADQIVFIRGDCVHEAVSSPVPRGHYEFPPLLSAGWTRRNPFWTRSSTADTTFEWQNPSNPFAYPDVGTPSDQGTMAVSYPVSVTDALMLPLKGKTHPVPKKQRLAMKKRMSAQLLNY